MIDLQAVKFFLNTRPSLGNNNTYIIETCDTKGYDYATIVVAIGATDVAMTTLKVQESDDDFTYSDVVGAIFGTSALPAIDGGATSALPTANDDGKLLSVNINLKGRKRYLQTVATAGIGTVGTYACILTILSRAEQTPMTAAQRNVIQNLIV